MKKLSMILMLVTTTALAQGPQVPPGSEEKELAELLSILEEETEVATKTRMNSDYVPGIVTVLHGDDLEALGVATAGEALSLVPGMQGTRDGRAGATVIVRGIDFPFNNGNIQILINSIPITRQDGGINAAALLIPIEQVERIEVIRGPGSVVYGDFAFMGLVNIVTRSEGTRVFAHADTVDLFTGGARVGWKSSGSGPWKASINVARGASGDAPAPFPADDADEDRWFGTAGVARGGLTLSAQFVSRDFDGRQQGNQALFFDETSWALDGRYRRAHSPALEYEGRVTFLRNDVDNFVSLIEGDVVETGVDVLWNGMKRHSWLFGAEVSRSSIEHAEFRPAPPRGQPPPATRSVLAVDEARTIFGVTVQDRFDLTDTLSLTAGARFDSYSDLEERVTPRVAIVWRARDRHIVKAQYAEGFRPPTFFELYSPPAPPPFQPRYPFEVNATSEINYIFKSAGRVARATIFRSVINDLVRPGGVVTPGNARALGLELEWSQQINPKMKVDANVSFVDTVDPRAPGITPDRGNAVSAGTLANVALFYRPIPAIFVGFHVNYVGNREGGDGFNLVDLTLSKQDLFVKGIDVRAGVKNIMDDEPVYLTQPPNGPAVGARFPGRSVWVQLGWRR